MKGPTVLVLSSDDLAAALLGGLVETIGHSARFALPGETPRDSLRRVRPDLVLVDCDHEEACSDAFFGPAKMMGAGVVLFGPAKRADTLARLGASHRAVTVRVPLTAEELENAVRAARVE